MTIREDDRTRVQKQTHNWLVTAGEARDGRSKCAWACKREDVDIVAKWVRNRNDMKYVNVRNTPWYPQSARHVHIYVVNDGHPALG